MIDKTGIEGTVDFTLEWALDIRRPAQWSENPTPNVPEGPTFQEALKDQLGLRLESQKAPMDVIVVDHVEHPSEN